MKHAGSPEPREPAALPELPPALVAIRDRERRRRRLIEKAAGTGLSPKAAERAIDHVLREEPPARLHVRQ